MLAGLEVVPAVEYLRSSNGRDVVGLPLRSGTSEGRVTSRIGACVSGPNRGTAETAHARSVRS